MSETIYQRFLRAINGPWETAGLDVQFSIVDLGETAEISFQGSVSPFDWRSNFDFFVEPYREMPVRWLAHKGFVLAYKSVRDQIIERIKSKKNVTILGYSRGGALAQLCHEDIAFNLPGISLESYVFGAPRVLWMPPFEVRERFYGLMRFENVGDIVPHIPPAWTGYRHVGGGYKVGSFGEFVKNIFPIKSWDQLPGAKSHLVRSYSEALKDKE